VHWKKCRSASPLDHNILQFVDELSVCYSKEINIKNCSLSIVLTAADQKIYDGDLLEEKAMRCRKIYDSVSWISVRFASITILLYSVTNGRV